MSFAVFDNPATMMREAWKDGECREAMSWLVIDQLIEYPGKDFPFYFNHGPFQAGQRWGDDSHLTKKE